MDDKTNNQLLALKTYHTRISSPYEVLDIQIPRHDNDAINQELDLFKFIRYIGTNVYRFVVYEDSQVYDDDYDYYMIPWYFGIRQGLLDETIILEGPKADNPFNTITMDIPKVEGALINLGYNINPITKSARKC